MMWLAIQLCHFLKFMDMYAFIFLGNIIEILFLINFNKLIT